MKTEPRSDEADWGGVGVFGEVGTEAEGGVSGGSVSGMLLKVILCGGSRSRGTGWPFSVPEVEVRTGRIPGDFSVYTVFLGCGGQTENSDLLGSNPGSPSRLLHLQIWGAACSSWAQCPETS